MVIRKAVLRAWIVWCESCGYTTDIQGRSQTLYTTMCNGVVSHGAQIRGLHLFADNTQKKKKKKRCKTYSFTIFGLQTAVDAGDIPPL